MRFTDRYAAAVWLPGTIGLLFSGAWLFGDKTDHSDILTGVAFLALAGYSLLHRAQSKSTAAKTETSKDA